MSIKNNLAQSQLVYKEISDSLKRHRPFDYAIERQNTFSKVSLSLTRQLSQIASWEKNGRFLEEIEDNIENTAYFKHLDKVFEKQFNLISKFSQALYIFFNDKLHANKLFNDFQGLEEKSDYVPFMKERSEKELDEIKQYIIAEYDVPESDAIAMIIAQDTEWRDLYGTEDILPKLSKQDFILSIQIYYIDISLSIENWVKDYTNLIQSRITSEDFTDGIHSEDFINLKYGKEKGEIISKIYDVIKNKDIECSFEDFKTVFYPGDFQIKWLGSQGNLGLLFKGNGFNSLDYHNTNIFKALAAKFKTKKGAGMNYKQLSTSYTKLTGTSKQNSAHIEKFLLKLSY